MKVKKEEKILVLATAQRDSVALIEYGFSLALACGGELHILHVQKGNSVFDGFDNLRQLQGMVIYGGRLGACVHLKCGQDVAFEIGEFVKKEGITRLVMGEGSKEKTAQNLGKYILEALPKAVEIHSVSKEEAVTNRLIG